MSRAQHPACHWQHPHAAHDMPAVLADPDDARTLHLDPVNLVHCEGRP